MTRKTPNHPCGMLRSDDGGRHWRKVKEACSVADRPFYYSLQDNGSWRGPAEIWQAGKQVASAAIALLAPGEAIEMD